MSQVYVVIRKYNHYSSFPPAFVPSPVVEWNAGTTHIKGVFAYYPSHYAHNMGYQIYGPYVLQGSTFPRIDHIDYGYRGRIGHDLSRPSLNYPPSSFDFGKRDY